MPPEFTALLDDLVAASHRRAAPQAARRAPVVLPWPALSTRPDAGMAKALTEISELHVETALGGLKPSLGVTAKGVAGGFRIVDVDAAGGRAKIVQVRDPVDDPAGVNFFSPQLWVAIDMLVHAPAFDAPGVVGGNFAGVLEVTTALRAGEARIADIKARAAALVKRKRAELNTALRDGQISGMDAIQNEILLNAFATRMGL